MAMGSPGFTVRCAAVGAAFLVINATGMPSTAVAQEAVVIELPAPRLDGGAAIERVLAERRSVREYAAGPVALASAAQLLWSAQGITEPGQGLRTAPSAGARFPLEAYLVVGDVTGLDPGVYHYLPHEHALALTADGDLRSALADASLRQRCVAEAPLSVVLAAVYARTEGRYGGRAARYVHMEVGTAAQNVALQAVSLGLGTVFVGAFQDDRVARVLHLPDDHAPLAILPVGPPR